MAAAAKNGGGVVYFPRGQYFVKGPLVVAPGTILRGAGRALARCATTARKTPIETFSTTIQPSYKHHTTSTEPTKDKSPYSVKVASEKGAKSAQKLGQRQPFMAVFSQEREHGPTCIFWADLTPFSL